MFIRRPEGALDVIDFFAEIIELPWIGNSFRRFPMNLNGYRERFGPPLCGPSACLAIPTIRELSGNSPGTLRDLRAGPGWAAWRGP